MDAETSMAQSLVPSFAFRRTRCAILPPSSRTAVLVLAVGLCTAAQAESEWSLLFEPMYMDAFGHDPHILTVREFDDDANPQAQAATPVALDTESGPAYRFEARYAADDWTLGLDFFWFNTGQGRPTRSGSAAAPFERIEFEVADRILSADAPGETLTFAVLEDTDIIAWTVDVYANRRLVESDTVRLDFQFGLRNADFDNDFHSVTALQDTNGSQIDASSNYPRMLGPLLGLSAEARFAGSVLRGYLGQSLIFGTAELRHFTTDFTGPAASPTIVNFERFAQDREVAIPITEARLNWLYPLGERFQLGVSANTSLWWDVPVPPGVTPGTGADTRFEEKTIVYFGLAAAVKFRL
jgi:hypothetical protein